MRCHFRYWNMFRFTDVGFSMYLDELEKVGLPVPDDFLEAVADALKIKVVRVDSYGFDYVTELRTFWTFIFTNILYSVQAKAYRGCGAPE